MTDSAHVPASLPVTAWLSRLSEPTAAPGGGAASAIMLGLSAALLRMVAEYSSGERATECSRRLSALRIQALEGSESDGVRSAELGEALALDAGDPSRDERVRRAAMDAADSAAAVGELGTPLGRELRLLVDVGNPALVSDLAVAAQALVAGLAAASINLRSNIGLARAHGGEGEQVTALHAASDSLEALQASIRDIADVLSDRFALD